MLGSSALVGVNGIQFQTMVLVGLAIPAGWLRFKLKPTGQVTLAPLMIFAAILLDQRPVPVLVATFAALMSSRFFGRARWMDALQDTGEEGIAALLAVAVLPSTLSHVLADQSMVLFDFGLAVLVYVGAKLTASGLRSRATEGVRFAAFIAMAGKSLAANLVFFALLASALSYLIRFNADFGYLALGLTTVALIEFYQPWKLLSEQNDVLFASLSMIAQAVDIKDPYTARHSRNVADIAVRIARAMRLSEEEVRKIRIGALLHDIGKIGVSGRIIRKPSKLETDEAQMMRKHPVISADIMQPIELLTEAADIVRHHHEHYDGSGYPDNLKGEGIPLGSRVILVADAFDAMTTDRPYRRGRSKEEALRVLKEHAGKQFDPRVVDALDSIIDLL